MSTALLAALVAAGSVFTFVVWYLRSKTTLEARVRSLGEQQRLVVEAQEPFTQRVAFPLVDGLVRAFAAVLPTSLVGRAKRWLITAGDTLALSQFLTIVLLAATALPAAYFLLAWVGAGGTPSFNQLLPIPILFAVGLFAPFFFVRRLAKNRQRTIWKTLPNAIDLLTTCVEAGLSLDLALQRVGDRYKGPLSAEIQRTLREIGLGKARRDALNDMAERIGLPDVMTFVNSIIQAEAMGTSVGQVLRAQAVQMRMRRRQRAEQVARQAPAKMAFPLVLFLMPSLFIVTIGPVALNVIEAFQEV